jgi:putative ABC transport system substrate-binding protein
VTLGRGAFSYVADAMVSSQARLIIDAARAKKLATMFNERNIVVNGALAGYGPNFKEIGRLSAKHVVRILAGTKPSDLPVENTRTLEFLINLRTAHQLGLTIPPEVVQRADDVIR